MFRSYSIYLLLAAFFAFVKVSLYSKILGPKYFGTIDLVFSISAFIPYIVLLGLDQAMARQLGRLFVTSSHDRIIELRNKVLTFCLVIVSSLSLLYVLTILIWFSKNTLVKDVMISIIPFSLGTIITNLLLIEYRAGQNLILYSRILALRNFLTILFGALAAFWLKNIVWITLAEFFANFVIFVLLVTMLENVRLNFKFDRYIKLLVKKFAFFNISAFLRSGARLVDRGIIAYTLSLTELGHYSFSMILLSGGTILAGVVSTYLEPKWIIDYKVKGDTGKLLLDSIKVGAGLMLAAAIVYYPAIKILEYVITRYFVEFMPVLGFMPWVYIGTVFYTINFFENFFLSIGKGGVQIMITIINIVIAIIVLGIIALWRPTLLNYSIGFCVISISSFFVGMTLAFRTKNSYK